MKSKFNFVLVFLLIILNGFGQKNPNLKIEKFLDKNDFIKIYQELKITKPDSIHRVCITFLKRKQLLDNNVKLEDFCIKIKEHCKKDKNLLVQRRIEIIELTGKLKFQKASTKILNKQFKELYQILYYYDDFSAALECMFELAQIHIHNKEELEALKVLFFCEKFAIKNKLQKDIIYQGVVFKIGYLFLELEKYKPSIKYFKKSILTGNSTQMDSLISLNGIGINYQKLNDFSKSNVYFKRASQNALNVKNEIFNAIILGNTAVNYFQLNNLEKAYTNAYIDKNSSVKNELWKTTVGDLYWLIQIELKRNNVDHSRVLLDSLNLIMNKITTDDFKYKKRQHEAAFLFYKKTKNHEKALNSFQNLTYYKELFEKKSSSDKISLLQISAASQIFEEEMKVIENKKKVKNIIILLGFTAILILVLFTIRFFVIKVKKIEKDKMAILKVNSQQTAEIALLKKALFEKLEQIQSNNNLNKNEQDIELLKKFNLSKKDQWESFRELFFKTYPFFSSVLSNYSQKYSSAELRLIMLHKLKLSNKEIAKTLLISDDGVKKANYRLYKKLNITSNEELNTLLLD